MNINHPTTPYSSDEQSRIMKDLETHLKNAEEQGDVAQTYYAKEALATTHD